MPSRYPVDKKIWFPAKRYGLGWGLPIVWQGWVVLVSYFILLLGGTIWLLYESIAYYLLYVFIITIILIVICFIKGKRLG